jgi:hypothetical protein
VGHTHKSSYIKCGLVSTHGHFFRFRGVVTRLARVYKVKSHELPTRVKEVMARFVALYLVTLHVSVPHSSHLEFCTLLCRRPCQSSFSAYWAARAFSTAATSTAEAVGVGAAGVAEVSAGVPAVRAAGAASA